MQQALADGGQALGIGPGHRAVLVGGEAVAVEVDQVDVVAAGGDVLFEDLRAFVDQGQQAAFEDFLLTDAAALVTEAFGLALHQRVHFRIVFGLAAARGIDVVALAGFLAEAALFAQAVVHLHLGHVLALAGQLAGAPFQVDADHVVHAERPHGETETL
ncbi:hypothetical protein D3C85_1429200 [compost metagenome]